VDGIVNGISRRPYGKQLGMGGMDGMLERRRGRPGWLICLLEGFELKTYMDD